MSIFKFSVYLCELMVREPVEDARLWIFGLNVLESQGLCFKDGQLGSPREDWPGTCLFGGFFRGKKKTPAVLFAGVSRAEFGLWQASDHELKVHLPLLGADTRTLGGSGPPGEGRHFNRHYILPNNCVLWSELPLGIKMNLT